MQKRARSKRELSETRFLRARFCKSSDLKFYRLNDLLTNSEQIQDAHLLILLNRLAHGLGVN
jgi:hypothetical protein